MPPKKKKSPLTQDQLAVYDFFIIRGFMFILLFACLYAGYWILSELFKDSTSESDRWKYSGLGTMVIGIIYYIVRHFFPAKNTIKKDD